MNILIFSWRDTKHKWAGGAEIYIQELAKRLVLKGNSVTLFCGNGAGEKETETLDGVKIRRRGNYYSVYLWAFVYYLFRFRQRFDVVIDSENGIPFFTPLYVREKKFLLIHHVHQEVFRKSLIPPLSWIALFIEAKLMPLVYRDVEVITVSGSSKKDILKNRLTETVPTVIYNGVDLNRFRPGEKNKTPLVLYLGRLQYYKSLQVLVNAAKKVIDEIPSAKFVIAGEGGQKHNLKVLAKDLRIEKNIEFRGWVTEKEKIRLFQKAWVFVNPSLIEGWGITTIEANACGTPVVASDVSGLKDSIKNLRTGIKVGYGDADQFSSGIIRLINDKKLRERMSSESITWAKNFSWEKSADKLYSLLSKGAEYKNKDTQKLRIVFLDLDDIRNPLLSGGGARATFEVGSRLTKKGHQITVVCSKYPGYKDRNENGIRYKHIGTGTSNIRLNNLFFILSVPFFVRRIKEADIIVEYFTAPISALYSPLFTKIPVIGLTVSFEAGEFAKKYHLPFLSSIEKTGLKFYRYFIPLTSHYDKKIKKINKKAMTRVIPMGVGEEYFNIRKKSPAHILYLGRLDINQKGIDILLRAYGLIKDKINYPLIIAGGGPDKITIEKLIKKQGLTEKVKMIGTVSGREKLNFLSQSFLIAFPSRFESFSNTVLESLAAGVPVAAFDIPGISWATDKAVMKAKPFSVKQYSSLLLYANNLKFLNQISETSRTFAKKFSWENVSDTFEDFFKSVLNKERQKKYE